MTGEREPQPILGVLPRRFLEQRALLAILEADQTLNLLGVLKRMLADDPGCIVTFGARPKRKKRK